MSISRNLPSSFLNLAYAPISKANAANVPGWLLCVKAVPTVWMIR
jgi:hypothetical protein